MDNFRQLIDHSFPRCKEGMVPDPGDQIIFDAVDAVRLCNLTVESFMQKQKGDEMNVSELTDMETRGITQDEYFAIPATKRVWENRVKSQCEEKKRERYPDLMPLVVKVNTSAEEVGETKSDQRRGRENKKKRFDDKITALKQQISKLQEQKRIEKDADRREDITDEIEKKKEEIEQLIEARDKALDE